jgi:hypothetical protein
MRPGSPVKSNLGVAFIERIVAAMLKLPTYSAPRTILSHVVKYNFIQTIHVWHRA